MSCGRGLNCGGGRGRHSNTREIAGGKRSQSLLLPCLHSLQPAVETLKCIVNDKYPVVKLVSVDQRRRG